MPGISDTTFDLGVAICACNSERTIRRTLESLTGLAGRIVVVDSGSSDNTVEICRAHGAQVIHRAWAGYIEQTQFALDQCANHQWVLVIDSDESLEPQLRDSIRQTLIANDPNHDGWHINRKIWFMGDWLHHTYQPEWRLRLVRGGKARVTGVNPHYQLEVNGRTGKLRGDMRHDSWIDLSDMAQRQIRYAKIAADHHSRGGSLLNMLVNPPAAMLKQLVIKRGFLDGWRGMIAAGMTANSVMLKHAFIAADRRSRKRGSASEHTKDGNG